MVEAKKFDIKQWEKDVNALLTGLKKETKNKEFINKISDVQSVLKNAENLNQIISQSPFAQANIINSLILSGSSVSDLIELLRNFPKKKRRKSKSALSNAEIKKIIRNVKVETVALINEKYAGLCQEFRLKIEAVLEAISKIETSDDKEISEKLKSIISKTNSILKRLKDDIAKQLGTMQTLLEKIDKTITLGMEEIRTEITSLRNDVNNLNRSLTESQARIEATLKEHGAKLDTIINTLTDIKAKIAAIEELLKDLKPGSLKNLFDLIKDLTNTVNGIKSSVKGIDNQIADIVMPAIQSIVTNVNDLKVEFPIQTENVNIILTKLDELSRITGALVTKKDLEEWMQEIIEQIKSIKSTGPIRDHDEPDANKKFELMWLLVENEKVAKEMKKDEVLPKSKEYVLLNQYHITVNLNELKKELFASDFLTRKASELTSKGFDMEKAYLCLGARVVGTEKPWRWDIKHLKTSAPDIYNKLKGTAADKKSDAESIAEIENSLKKWKKHQNLKAEPNLTLEFYDEKTIKDVENIHKNLETLFRRHHDKFEKITLFQQLINLLALIVEAWNDKNTAAVLKEGAHLKHVKIIEDIEQLVEAHIKPALNR